jgi:predicted  nucleic acid-binding Zn ribbon protein
VTSFIVGIRGEHQYLSVIEKKNLLLNLATRSKYNVIELLPREFTNYILLGERNFYVFAVIVGESSICPKCNENIQIAEAVGFFFIN